MAEYGAAISLSQAPDLSHTSDDDDDLHTPRHALLLSPRSASETMSRSRNNTNSNNRNSNNRNNDDENNNNNNHRESGNAETAVVVRKPRGRPPGSKNKPKPPMVITRESEAALKPVVLEICAGADVVEQVLEYARRRHVGLSVLSGCGTVSSATLRHPMAHAPTISLHGPLHIVCLSGTYLGPTAAVPPPSSSSFSVSLSGSQGQVFGGIIAGNVTAQTPVVVVAATFASPTFHRLPPAEAEAEVDDEGNGGDIGSGGGLVVARSEAVGTSGGVPPGIYNMGGSPAASGLNGQMSPDVLHWSATAGCAGRQHHY